MSSNIDDEYLSDDDIFFGKMTLKEVKRRLLWNNRLQSTSVSTSNSPKKCDDLNTNVNILQVHSEPNLLLHKDIKDQNSIDNLSSDWESRKDYDDSPSSENFKHTQLNNTLEVIEYILNNPPNNECHTEAIFNNKIESPKTGSNSKVVNELCIKNLEITSPQRDVKVENIGTLVSSPKIVKNVDNKCISDTVHKTPVKLFPKTVFKTPSQTILNKKPVLSLKKTPNKFNAYQHIASPVASYINNSPMVPLIRNVNPKKPLPGSSFIPKLKSHIPVKHSNKENVKLPQLAYKSAKETEVIKLPDEQRLPQTQWAMKLMSSASKPVVITHAHRDFNTAKKNPLARKVAHHQEDSIADLSVHQAEMSVCVQKSALKQNRRA